MSFVVSPSLTLRTDVQRVQMPAKKASGRLSSSANQTGGREPSGRASFSEKLVNGTTQRLSDAEPSPPVRRGGVADVRHAGIGFCPSARRRATACPSAPSSARGRRQARCGRSARNSRGIRRASGGILPVDVAHRAGEVADRLLALSMQ